MSKAAGITTNHSEAWQPDRRHCMHPFHRFASFDEDGNEYFDAVGGMWCTNIGLGRDEMAAANDTAYRIIRMYQNARGKRDKWQVLRREGPRTDQDA